MHGQGSKASQEHFAKAIELCPDLAYAHFEMAVPYAKRGLMHEWIKKIDRAVALEPEMYLEQRGWYHWFFMHNYEKAIADIDSLDAMLDRDIGETGASFYHLNIMKGLCYKGLGQTQKAIDIMKECITSQDYYRGYYDDLHLGVLYMELGQQEEALANFKKQNSYNNVADAHYYIAKVKLAQNKPEEAKASLETALQKYDEGLNVHNPYRQLPDQIYRIDITDLMDSLGMEYEKL